MKSMYKIFAVSAAALVMVACGGSDSTDAADSTAKSQLQLVHASSNAPTVDILVNGAIFNNLTGVDYKVASANFSVDASSYSVQVDGILPGGTRTTVIGPVDVTLDADTDYKVIALNDVAAIEPLIVASPTEEVASDSVRVQVVHASPDASAAAAGDVDVYVTAPSATLADSTALGSFDFKGTLGPVPVPAGDYRIRITPTGSSTVVFDTGAAGITLPGGADLTVIAVDNTTAGKDDSPVSLLVLDDNGANELLDADTVANARVVHVSPNADTAASGDVEVFATSGGSSTELIPAFGYTDIVPAANDYVDATPADYTFTVAPDGAGVGGGVFTSGTLALTAGTFYSVLAVGDVASSFDLLVTEDEFRAVATEARVKVIHAAEDAGLVSVYVTPAGDFTTTQIENGDATALLSDFAFKTVSPYVAVTPGNYDIRVVPNASGTVAINVENFALTAGLVGTVIARQPNDNHLAPTDFGVIVLTN